MRGLKFRLFNLCDCFCHVALYVSAWIEITVRCAQYIKRRQVALYVSAWIEIIYHDENFVFAKLNVALYVSAWIEITKFVPTSSDGMSHSTRERGLK